MPILLKESFTRLGRIVFARRPAKNLQITMQRRDLSGPVAAARWLPIALRPGVSHSELRCQLPGLSSALGFSKRAPFTKEEDLRKLGEPLIAFVTS